jgi:hypothetical protein
MAKHYNVCAPRKYKNNQGEEKTHFWPVGKMFPMQDRDGFKIQLYTRVLPTDELLMFPSEPMANRTPKSAVEGENIPDDDIPF